MRILAIETVETTGSVAALEDDRVLAEHALNPAQRSAQSLAPGIDALLREIQWRPTDVELVSVARGPGSFTGLRIGLTTAKTFAYAVGCQLVGVNTHLAIASRVPGDVERFMVVLDAQRGELFVAEFERAPSDELVQKTKSATPPLPSGEGRGEGAVPNELTLAIEAQQGSPHPNPLPKGEGIMRTTRIVACRQWLDELVARSVVTGPGLAKIVQQLPREVVVIDRALWAPTASAIGRVGWQLFSAGERTDPFALLPDYVRRTAAEDQWDRKQAR